MIDKNRTSSLASKENDEIDFGRLLGTLVDHKWLIVSITSLFAVIGIIYSLFATPIYQADATVQVEQNEGNMLVSNLSQMLPNSLPASSTEIELISSRMIVGKTVEDLHLDTVVTQKYFPIFGRGWARLMGNKPGQVALSRLTVAEPLVESAIELEVIDDQNYVVTVDKDKIFQGKVGRLEN
ncbi:Wzz/FepE/Etk N-terminal domain-containing protein, partial [Serratia bockelmannii]